MGLFRLVRNKVRDRRGQPIVGRHRRRFPTARIGIRRDHDAAAPRHRLLLDALNAKAR
jgi:hypothetical protein